MPAPAPAMYSSKTSLSLSTTENMDKNAASAASLTGMTGLRTLAKMAGVRVGSLVAVREGDMRLTVRITTRARRFVSMGLSGVRTVARLSITLFRDSGFGEFFSTSRYFPAASTQLSDMKVWHFVSEMLRRKGSYLRSYFVFLGR